MKRFTDYFSATPLGLGNNNGINLKGGEYIFKSYYRLRVEGVDTYKLFFINQVESTGNCRPGKLGDGYEIVEAYAAYSENKEDETNISRITFDGQDGKLVAPGDEYETDEFEFTYKKEGYMVLAFRVKTQGRIFLPGTNESASTGRIFENGMEIWSDNFTLRPAFLGVKRNMTKTVAFWGDSITQGTRTGVDKYEAWAHRIGNAMDADVSFWNIGMGWSRAYDAVLGGVFFKKAAMCDEVFICFGVNDIRSGGRMAEELIADLKKIQQLLIKSNENIKIHLLTVPPFNMSLFEEVQRKKVNEYIKTTKGYFDIAFCLEADDCGSVIEKYMVNKDDSHPNGEGGRAVYEGFLKWKGETGW